MQPPRAGFGGSGASPAVLLPKLHDRLYRLESAVQDVDADLRELSGLRAYREALDHLLEAARDLVGVTVEPVRQ